MIKNKFALFFGIMTSVIGVSSITLMSLCATGKVNLIKQDCHIIFRNYDMSVLYETDVLQGENVEYKGPIPTKPRDDKDYYVFMGWTHSLTNVVRDFTAIAVFVSGNTIENTDLDNIPTDNDFDIPPGIETMPIMTVNTKQPGLVYLRALSFGDYDGENNKFREAPLYDPSLMSANSINPVNFTAQLADKYFNSSRITIKYSSLIDKIPFTDGILPVPQFNVDYKTKTLSDSYGLAKIGKDRTYVSKSISLGYSPKDIQKLKYLYETELTSEEKRERRDYTHFVKQNYLHVDRVYNRYFDEFKNSYHLKSDSANVFIDAVNALKDKADFTKIPITLPKNDDYVVHFFEEKAEGGSNQIATILTLLLRSLGIPSRAVAGFVYNNSTPGVNRDVSAENITCWVEAFIDGIGWIAIDPFINTPTKEDETDPDFDFATTPLTVSVNDVNKKYDGLEFKPQIETNGTLDENHHFVFNIPDMRNCKNVGTYNIHFTWKIVNDIEDDVTYLYEITKTKTDGLLTITPRDILIKTPDIDAYLDDYGTIDASTYGYKLLGDGLAPNQVLHIEYRIFDNSGIHENYLEESATRIYDSITNEDVTSNYNIDYEYGEAVIK